MTLFLTIVGVQELRVPEMIAWNGTETAEILRLIRREEKGTRKVNL